MLLLIRSNQRWCGVISCIYIPLCFYLYVYVECEFHDNKTNLHSTMLLLILSAAWLKYFVVANLHSTMLLLIPLVNQVSIGSSTFTFHYASTYTEFRFPNPANNIAFTFHYASTYTFSYNGIPRAYNHLHSTMLLLIPSQVGTAQVGITHLHSTMLLLIPVHFSLLIYIISYFLNCRPPFFAFPLLFLSSSIF